MVGRLTMVEMVSAESEKQKTDSLLSALSKCQDPISLQNLTRLALRHLKGALDNTYLKRGLFIRPVE